MRFMNLFKSKTKVVEKEKDNGKIDGKTEVTLLKKNTNLEEIKEKDISKKFLVNWEYDKMVNSLTTFFPKNIKINKKQKEEINKHILKVINMGMTYSQFSLGNIDLNSHFFKQLIERYPEYSKMKKEELKKEFERIDKEKKDFIKKIVPKQGIKYNANSKEYKKLVNRYDDLNGRGTLLSELVNES